MPLSSLLHIHGGCNKMPARPTWPEVWNVAQKEVGVRPTGSFAGASSRWSRRSQRNGAADITNTCSHSKSGRKGQGCGKILVNSLERSVQLVTAGEMRLLVT